MSDHPLDKPEITNNLFYVRKTAPPTHVVSDDIKYGSVQVADGASVGYMLYIHNSTAPVLVFFHGNGEIATDYEGLAELYHLCNVSLLVFDYRGYGWSDGTPLTSKMLPDAEKCLLAIDSILGQHGVVAGRPLFLKGRSLGSAPAIYLAHQHPEKLKGLIIESGYANAPSLFRRLGIPIPDDIADDINLPIYNESKIKEVHVPLLVIHGEQDTLIPVDNAKALYAASPAQDKQLVIINGAGHNNLLFAGTAKYFNSIKIMVEKYS